MATRAKTRQKPIAPTKKAREKAVPISADDVTRRLASTLTISNAKGVGTEYSGAPESIQDRRISIMRAVNTASQGLTVVMKSGWKAPSVEPSGKKSTTALHEAFGLATSAQSALGDLRVISPGDVDVERAAISVAGKLLSLDMYSHALDVLSDMHCRLVALVRPDLTPSISRPKSQMSPPLRDLIAIISLPLPTQSSKPLDPTLLFLISTYLSHSLIALSHRFSSSSLKHNQHETLVLYSQTLHDSPGLLRWIPLCTQLPAKQRDALLTRVYTALTSISSQVGTTEAVFRIRSHALMCLLLTSGSTIGPKTFWDQVVKFASSFAKSASSNDKREERRLCHIVTSAFSEILALVEERGNRDEFLHGMPFISFCDAWISYSKSADDVAALSKVISLVQSSPSTSIAGCDEEKLLNALSNLDLDDDGKGERPGHIPGLPSGKDKEKLRRTEIAHITKLCASFARTTTLLASLGQNDGAEEDVLDSIRETSKHVKEARAVRPPLEAQDDYKLAESKMRRALDRLKRAAVKVIDTPDDMRMSTDGVVNAARTLLLDIVTTTEALLSAGQESASEDYASLLDLFFVLARTTLAPNNPVLTDAAYDLLFRAARLLGFQLTNDYEYSHTISPPSSVTEEAFANFVRCLSGAFHSLGGMLYQAGKYGSAIRFLRRGCPLGAVALRLRGSCDLRNLNSSQEQPKTPGNKEAEGWGQLHDQLSRRWELLGVSCSKIGDRQGAYEAFIGCLGSYVFPRAFVELVRTIGPTSAFEAASSPKQAAVIIDRVTYMASCELLRPPTEVSLKRLISSISIGGVDNNEEERLCVIGAILERQIDSLTGSLWKPEVQSAVAGLLSDCVSIYNPENRPIRRAGVMLRLLELSFYTGAPDGNTQLEKSADEIKALLSHENVGRDSGLTHLLAVHRAEMHLWLALHAHRQAHPQQYPLIIKQVQEACRVLRRWIQGTPMETAKVKESPKQVRAARKGKGKTASVRAVAAATRRPKAPRVAPTTPKRPRKSDPSQESGSPAKFKTEKDIALMQRSSRRIVSLLNMAIHLVGFIGHVILKLELLQVARQVCEHLSIGQHDDFVQLSVQLANEYVKLGKLREAVGVYKRSLSPMQIQTVSGDTRVILLLRHAESLTRIGDIGQSIALYNEALQLSETLPKNEGESSTLDRVHSHVNRLRRAALAASVFAGIKLAQDDLTQSLTSLLQAIRLWHRAVSTLSHLTSREGSSSGTLATSNPFDVSSDSGKSSPTKDENHTSAGSITILHHARAYTNGIEWQIAEGMFETTLSLASAYLRRGSVREAEYFIREAEQLANSLNAPALICRALAMKVEAQLKLRQLEGALTTLRAATDTLNDITGPDAAGLHKLHGEYNELLSLNKDAQLRYTDALKMLEELDRMFAGLDARKRRLSSSLSSPLRSKENLEPPAPVLFSAVLRQHIWLLRDDIGDEYESLLHKLSQLVPLAEIQAEERSLLARLTLHDVYEHFQEDMFLSSIRESVLSLPMGASGDKYLLNTTSAQVIMRTLTDAGKLFHSVLTSTARCGSVTQVREAASSLVLIQSFQSSLGENDCSLLVVNLLDICANVTLTREMLEVISYKLPSRNRDDLRWPLLAADGTRLDTSSRKMKEGKFSPIYSDDDNDEHSEDSLLAEYWESIRAKYQHLPFDLAGLARSKVDMLPANWTVVHIYLTDDQNTMFISRQRPNQRPLIFSLPLKGRRETEDDEHLTFQDAITELREIVRLSDESTKSAISVKGQDQRARAAWWADRGALDKRLKELLESIEFCWFGAFKTVLSEQVSAPEEAMSAFRNRLDRIFEQNIGAQGKKRSIRVHINPALLECFSRLSPKCRDEELEDLVYFILDLYQFHGVQVAIAEVDVDHVVVDLRAALEEHSARVRGRLSPEEDEHVFLVLNRCLQEIPWESLPILRGRSISRIPNVDFLIDRLEFAQRRRQSESHDSDHYDGQTRLDSSSTYYILNPSGDLEGTERRFSPWLKSMKAVGWDGIIGRPPSEQEFSHALLKNELVIYFGHGGGEQYIRSHKIRHLPRCAATMLWGCSSGLLRDMGEFDRIGTPYNYMLAGCPTLIANLWDVTDRDIDKLTQAVFDKMRLTPEAHREKTNESDTDGISIVRALAEAREVCKLKYITGAAPVVYGIPFYL